MKSEICKSVKVKGEGAPYLLLFPPERSRVNITAGTPLPLDHDGPVASLFSRAVVQGRLSSPRNQHIFLGLVLDRTSTWLAVKISEAHSMNLVLDT